MSHGTRRSISVKGETYQRLKNFCDLHKQSMSGYLERIIAERMDDAKIPIPTEVAPPRPRERVEVEPEPPARSTSEIEAIISQHFTF